MQTVIYVKRKEAPRTSQAKGTWFQWIQTDKGKLTTFKQEEADKLKEGGYYDVEFDPSEDGRGGIIRSVMGVAQDAPPPPAELPGMAAPDATTTSAPAPAPRTNYARIVDGYEREYRIAVQSTLNRATDLLQARIQMDPEYRKTGNAQLAKDALEIAKLLLPFVMETPAGAIPPAPAPAVPAVTSTAVSGIPGLVKGSTIAQPAPAPTPAPVAPVVKQDGVFTSSATTELLKNRLKKITVKKSDVPPAADEPMFDSDESAENAPILPV